MKMPPFVNYQGECYVRANNTGIHFLSLFVDGVQFYYFSETKPIKNNTRYIKLETAINWHETEIRETKGKWKREALEMLLDARAKFKIEQKRQNKTKTEKQKNEQ